MHIMHFWPSHFILSGALSNCSALLQYHIGHFQPGGLIFWCHIFCFLMLFMES